MKQPKKAQESTSGFFPADSQFDNPLEKAFMPPETDTADIEETAHFLNYTTPKGAYCELWWKGGDGGTPLLSYLVDKAGAHYLASLSQPKLDGNPAFANLEEARDKFIVLARAFYESPKKGPAS